MLRIHWMREPDLNRRLPLCQVSEWRVPRGIPDIALGVRQEEGFEVVLDRVTDQDAIVDDFVDFLLGF